MSVILFKTDVPAEIATACPIPPPNAAESKDPTVLNPALVKDDLN